MRKLTREEFISNAVSVHGDRYDYSRVKYTDSKTKVKIICQDHGTFEQAPNCHVSQGQGCPKCASRGRMNTSNFIYQAQIVHGSKYDYSKVKSNNSLSKVSIGCAEHGVFKQKVSTHLDGHGCPRCAILNQANIKRKSVEEFTREAIAVKGDIYDYSKFIYINTNTKGEIVCPEHGSFWQTPKQHLRGNNCPYCAKNSKLDSKTFAKKARKIHRDKYLYNDVDYKNVSTPVVIYCKIHGAFVQKPSDHLSGNGCQSCAAGGYKDNLRGYLYVLKSDEYVKIGISNQPKKRIQDLKSDTPFPFLMADLLYSDDGVAVRCVESIIHNSFKSAGLTGFSGCTEWLIPCSDLYLCLYDICQVYGLKKVKEV